METTFDFIAFDADDTLWHSERLYAEAQKQFTQMLSNYHDAEWINDRLYQTEIRNIHHFGYGIKACALSLIETAIELTEGRISSKEIQKIVEWAKIMLNSEVELLPHVSQIIPQLSRQYPMMIITKGDLLDQETKIKKSGLGKYFQHIEIVSQKTFESYEKLLKKYSVEPRRFMMIGNSLPSDILPVLKLGGSAVHIPYEITWLHETAQEPPRDHSGYYELEDLGQLPPLLDRITENRVT
ncbi:MAG: HAD family hydrolase [Anaerolineales bacterium]|nr:HAD family hydrolase [Anaerolineales bacterium]